MEVKDAARVAIEYVTDLFKDQQISDVGLEEAEMDNNNAWLITVGFHRSAPQNALTSIQLTLSGRLRSFKVVKIDDATGKVLSLKNRSHF